MEVGLRAAPDRTGKRALSRFRLSVVLSVQPARFRAATFKGDLEANVARIAELGYDGVELAIRDPEQVDADELVALVGRHGLDVPAVGTGQAWGEERLSFTDTDPRVRRAARERIGRHLPFAGRVGAVVILGLIRGVPGPGESRDRAVGWLVEALAACAEAARPRGVRLAVEPIERGETPLVNRVEEGLALLERVGASNLGLLLDTYHMSREEVSVEAAIRAAGERIFHFHVADSNRWYPGGGDLDFGALLGVLEETGYRGYVSGEFLPEPDPDTAAREAIRHLRNVITPPP